MKKIVKLFTAVTLLVINFGVIQNINAEGATNASTTIEIEVTDDNKPLDPSIPPTDTGDPTKPGVINPQEDDQSRPNTGIGDAKLAIWRIPSNMNFKGKYDPVLDIELELDYDASTQENRRYISVADVRKGANTDWKLTSQLVGMKDKGSQTANDELNNNTSLTMDAKALKHKVNGNHVYAKEFIENDNNGVQIDETLTINHEENTVAVAQNGMGKGYTGLIFENIKLNIKGGYIDSADEYIGQINWTLSSTVD